MVMILPLNLHVMCEYRYSYNQYIMTFSLSLSLSRTGCCSSGRPFLPCYIWATAILKRSWPGRLCHKASSVPRFCQGFSHHFQDIPGYHGYCTRRKRWTMMDPNPLTKRFEREWWTCPGYWQRGSRSLSTGNICISVPVMLYTVDYG